MSSQAAASSCYYVTCPPGYGGGLPNCSSICARGTFQDGTGTVCRNCSVIPGMYTTSQEGASGCFSVPLPADSTCTPRPTTSSVKLDCPTASGVSWIPLNPSNTLPARCFPPNNKKCDKPPAGLFTDGVELVEVSDGSCACKNWQDGFVPVKLLGSNKVSCVQTAMYVSDTANSSTVPATNGIWLSDVSTNGQSCRSARSCWDMCFFCDGRPRYSKSSPGSNRVGTADVAQIEETASSTCTSTQCPLGAVTRSNSKKFSAVCDDYRKAVLAAGLGTSSRFRPDNMPNSVFRVLASIPGATSPKWGQQVLVWYGNVIS
eukprot:gene4822-5069_t